MTSNVDGHWARVIGAHELWECHGAVTHLQSSSCVDGPIWAADPHVMARAAPPPWTMKPGDVVEVQLMKGNRHECRLSAAERKGSWALATVADDSISLILPKPSAPPPLSKQDHKAFGQDEVQVCAIRKPGGGQELSRVAAASLLPHVPPVDSKMLGGKGVTEKGVLARPNVYMFGDKCVMSNTRCSVFAAASSCGCFRRSSQLTSFSRLMNWSRVKQQEVRFNEWLDSLPAAAPLVIVEVKC